MKKIISIFIFVLILSGCTYTAVNETGNAIDSNKVALIVKGKTTESEISSMFGQPLTKTVISETDTKWIYQHIVSKASAQAYTGKTNSSLTNEVLDILFRNGVVVNFSFSQSESNPKMSVSQSL